MCEMNVWWCFYVDAMPLSCHRDVSKWKNLSNPAPCPNTFITFFRSISKCFEYMYPHTATDTHTPDVPFCYSSYDTYFWIMHNSIKVSSRSMSLLAWFDTQHKRHGLPMHTAQYSLDCFPFRWRCDHLLAHLPHQNSWCCCCFGTYGVCCVFVSCVRVIIDVVLGATHCCVFGIVCMCVFRGVLSIWLKDYKGKW